MLKKKYNFCSKTIEVYYTEGLSSHILMDEMSLYKESNNPPSVIININPLKTQKKEFFFESKVHKEYDNGLLCDFGNCLVCWEKRDKLIYIELTIDEYKKNLRRKYLGIQYTHPFEEIGQIFHELVLIPTLYFFSDEVSLIHASAIANKKGDVFLFAGVGGVGKTFIELYSILKNDFYFVADDISFLTSNGQVYSNLAFPKIYDYNTKQEPLILKKIFSERSVFDKGSWIIRSKILNSTVRRRVNPDIFFNGKIVYDGKLSKIFFLLPTIEKSSVNPILSDKIAESNLEILKSEYGIFHNHLYWHKGIRNVLGKELILDFYKITNDWFQIQQRILKNNSFLVKIPIDFSKRKIVLKNLINFYLG